MQLLAHWELRQHQLQRVSSKIPYSKYLAFVHSTGIEGKLLFTSSRARAHIIWLKQLKWFRASEAHQLQLFVVIYICMGYLKASLSLVMVKVLFLRRCCWFVAQLRVKRNSCRNSSEWLIGKFISIKSASYSLRLSCGCVCVCVLFVRFFSDVAFISRTHIQIQRFLICKVCAPRINCMRSRHTRLLSPAAIIHCVYQSPPLAARMCTCISK